MEAVAVVHVAHCTWWNERAVHRACGSTGTRFGGKVETDYILIPSYVENLKLNLKLAPYVSYDGIQYVEEGVLVPQVDFGQMARRVGATDSDNLRQRQIDATTDGRARRTTNPTSPPGLRARRSDDDR